VAPQAFLVHDLPGRLRVRVPSMRGEVGYFERVLGALEDLPTVEWVTANPLTASVLVQHGQGSADEFLRTAPLADLLTLSSEPPRHEALAERMSRLSGELDRRLRNLSADRVDTREAALWILVLAALLQLSRGTVLPPAGVLLWYALTLMRGLPPGGEG
jgi:hypothetical protein